MTVLLVALQVLGGLVVAAVVAIVAIGLWDDWRRRRHTRRLRGVIDLTHPAAIKRQQERRRR